MHGKTFSRFEDTSDCYHRFQEECSNISVFAMLILTGPEYQHVRLFI